MVKGLMPCSTQLLPPKMESKGPCLLLRCPLLCCFLLPWGVLWTSAASCRGPIPYQHREAPREKKVRIPLGFSAPSDRHGLIPCLLPNPAKPVPACGSAPMLSRAPELGWVPIRQADITESHIQTWKQPIQWDSLSHLSPLGPRQGWSVGTRQMACIQFPGRFLNT